MQASKILVITASVMPLEKSYSDELAHRFVKHYQKHYPQDKITWLDLNTVKMAEKTMTRANFGQFFNQTDSGDYINQLKQVNKVVFACPMMNFAISTMAKNYLDHILLAGQTFSYKYTKKGDAIGLLDHLKVQILTTQGAPLGWYPWGDLVAYLKGTWEFVGAKVSQPLTVAGTKVPPTNELTPAQLIDQYDQQIEKLALQFGKE
ncbi:MULTISPECIES: FMN-dependent NADH-azoreductase [unclassified Mycoplasma]|uniref:FMN-dependent NADH-azoreductase n=1 Tax=unclassified Mycoplasma TaxID=2683645 RepID=UPI000FDEBB38